MNRNKGFTLIELMIVVAIIGILASVAIPSYQNYVVRTKVSEGLRMADGSKTAIEEGRISMGRFLTASNASYGLPSPTSITGNNVGRIDIGASGTIVITYSRDTAISGNTLILKPTAVTAGGSIRWSCTSTGGLTLKQQYRPASCRS